MQERLHLFSVVDQLRFKVESSCHGLSRRFADLVRIKTGLEALSRRQFAETLT
jgi:hypothetical protein